MKQLFLILFVAGICAAQTVYRVKDLNGRTIIDTKDKALVRQLSNVKVDTLVTDSIRISQLRDSSFAKNLRDALEQSLGKPAAESYHCGWLIEGGGEIYLMKQFKQRPLIQYNREGRIWLRKYVPGLLEDPIETRACTTITNMAGKQ